MPAHLRGRASCRLACADDCRAGVLVDSVGLTYFDAAEPGVRERLLELLAGQRSGYAACPLPHIGASFLVHVLVGDHVGDREAPTPTQDARGLTQHPRLMTGEVEHAV